MALFSKFSVILTFTLFLLGAPMQAGFAEDISPRLEETKTAIAEGRYVEAEESLKQIIAISPDTPETHYQLGISLHQQYRLREAILAYQSALDLDPDYDAPYINLGLAWIEGQRPEKAIAVFQRVLSLPDNIGYPASNHTLAHYNLAIIYKRQDLLEQSLTETQAALSITPSFEPAQELITILQNK